MSDLLSLLASCGFREKQDNQKKLSIGSPKQQERCRTVEINKMYLIPGKKSKKMTCYLT